MNYRYLITLFLIIIVTGCSPKKLFNPYEEDFACKGGGNNGDCMSTREAYEESLRYQYHCDNGKYRNKKRESAGTDKNGKEKTHKPMPPTSGDIYRDKKFETLTKLVDEEAPPLVVPPDVVRVLILPYTSSDNDMYGLRYSYFFATEPSWQFVTGHEE